MGTAIYKQTNNLQEWGQLFINRPTTFKNGAGQVALHINVEKTKGADHQWQQLNNVPTTLTNVPTTLNNVPTTVEVVECFKHLGDTT